MDVIKFQFHMNTANNVTNTYLGHEDFLYVSVLLVILVQKK